MRFSVPASHCLFARAILVQYPQYRGIPRGSTLRSRSLAPATLPDIGCITALSVSLSLQTPYKLWESNSNNFEFD